MDTAYIPAFAALTGSVIGGLTSLAASWLSQHVQFRAQQLAQDLRGSPETEPLENNALAGSENESKIKHSSKNHEIDE